MRALTIKHSPSDIQLLIHEVTINGFYWSTLIVVGHQLYTVTIHRFTSLLIVCSSSIDVAFIWSKIIAEYSVNNTSSNSF